MATFLQEPCSNGATLSYRLAAAVSYNTYEQDFHQDSKFLRKRCDSQPEQQIARVLVQIKLPFDNGHPMSKACETQSKESAPCDIL
eukprot:405728-Amphidinium_carterae.1